MNVSFWQDSAFQFSISSDLAIADMPEFLLRIPFAASCFQSFPQHFFGISHYHRHQLVIPVDRMRTHAFFLDNYLNRFQSNATHHIQAVTDTEQRVTVLVHQPLCPFLARLQMGLRLHVPQHANLLLTFMRSSARIRKINKPAPI